MQGEWDAYVFVIYIVVLFLLLVIILFLLFVILICLHRHISSVCAFALSFADRRRLGVGSSSFGGSSSSRGAFPAHKIKISAPRLILYAHRNCSRLGLVHSSRIIHFSFR